MCTIWRSGAALGCAMVLAAALSAAAWPVVTGTAAPASCPAAPCGPHFYAPGTGKTVALTFDDGPGKSTAGCGLEPLTSATS
jgi:peptidoglycan/xylan/chitin deacetylase (PgdA/CDA1 family)